MQELELRRDGAIGPRDGTPFANERVSPRKSSQDLFDRLHGHIRSGRNGCAGERRAYNARDLQQAALGLIQTIELALDRPANIARYMKGIDLEIIPKRPSALVTEENAPTEQVVEHIDEEKGISFRVLVDDLGQPSQQCVGTRRRRESLRDVLDDRVLVQRCERNLLTETPDREVADDRVWRLRQVDHLFVPVRAKQQHGGALRTPCERGDPVQRRRIAPVKILEAEDDSRLYGHGVERLCQLSEHALRCCSGGPSLECSQLSPCLQAGQLREPRGRVSAQRRDKGLPLGLSTQSRQRIE